MGSSPPPTPPEDNTDLDNVRTGPYFKQNFLLDCQKSHLHAKNFTIRVKI